jgi:hypothetical protein
MFNENEEVTGEIFIKMMKQKFKLFGHRSE